MTWGIPAPAQSGEGRGEGEGGWGSFIKAGPAVVHVSDGHSTCTVAHAKTKQGNGYRQIANKLVSLLNQLL